MAEAAGTPAAPPAQAILFDIDGTLIHSGGSSDRAWHRAFEELHGVDVQISKITGKGVPDPEVGRQAFVAVIGREPTTEEMAALLGKRLEHLAEEVESSERYEVMPAVDSTLESLIDAGVLLGLTTGNVEGAAHIKLARANLNRFFSFGGYGSDSPDRTELTKRALERGGVVAGAPLDPARCYSVGDTPRDIEAGHGTGIRVCGVATGEYSTEQLLEAGADWAIEDLTEGLPHTLKVVNHLTDPFSRVAEMVRAESMAKDHLRERLVFVAIVSVVVALVCSVLALVFERHGTGTEITNFGDSFFWVSTQLLTVSSQMKNPVTTGGRILDVFMEIYAISVVATLAGSFGAFFHRRSREREQAQKTESGT